MPRFHPSQQLHVLPLILDIYDIFRTLEHAASVRRLTEKEREGERRRTRARGIPRGGGEGGPTLAICKSLGEWWWGTEVA